MVLLMKLIYDMLEGKIVKILAIKILQELDSPLWSARTSHDKGVRDGLISPSEILSAFPSKDS